MKPNNPPTLAEEFVVFNNPVKQVGWRNWFPSKFRLDAINNVWNYFYLCKNYYLQKTQHEEKVNNLQETIDDLKIDIAIIKEKKAVPFDEHQIALASLERSGAEKLKLLNSIEKLEHENRKLQNKNQELLNQVTVLKSENIKLCAIKELVNKFIKDVKFKQTIEKEEECNSPF